MKSLVFILLIFPILASAQEVINEQESLITIQGFYYLESLKITDSGGPVYDTVRSVKYLGDSDDVLQRIWGKYESLRVKEEGEIGRAFGVKLNEQVYLEYLNIIKDISGLAPNQSLTDRFSGYHYSEYRVHTQDTSFYARVVDHPSISNRVILTMIDGKGGSAVPGENWVFIPLGVESFRINQFNGINYEFVKVRADGIRRNIYLPKHQISLQGSNQFRIVKLQ